MINKTIKVLLLADNSSLEKRIDASLFYAQTHVFNVINVTQKEKALELIKNTSIDVCLLDLSVTHHQSAEYVYQLQYYSPRTIVILLSSGNNTDIVKQALNQGAYEFINKYSLGQHWLIQMLAFSLLQPQVSKLKKISRKNLYDICNHSMLGIMVSDLFGNITYTNQAFNDVTQYSATKPVGYHWTSHIHKGDKSRLLEDIQEGQKNNKIVCSDVCMNHQNKQKFKIRITGTPIEKNKDPYGYIITVEDLTAPHNKTQQISLTHQVSIDFLPATTAQLTLDAMSDSILSADINNNVLYLNKAASTLTGWDCHEAVGLLLTDIFKIKETALVGSDESIIIRSQRENRPFDCTLLRKDGAEIEIEESARSIVNEVGKNIGAVFIFRDVTQSQLKAIEMTHIAQHDPLTGLPNRLLFKERLNQAIMLAKRHKKLLAILYLDIDLFKDVNDKYGHELGDKLLCSVASRISDSVRLSDTVCRQGGDEFLILLSEIEHPNDAVIFTTKLLHSLINPHQLNGKNISVHISIGIRIFPDHIDIDEQETEGELSDALIDDADKAMYQAKLRGHDGYQVFSV
ncbi:diguanylate cyclase domain-containing protein [Pseudocolwellia sp. HL-MZ7]|uniref:diguanylate cyclase domain-containing protein n=1 Tax=Pseudocolwellia sp. HL-MZ7 TaxID=3400627 RepID=UPI003CF9F666